MLSVYLAAQYHRKSEIAKYADELRALGIEVTSTWLKSEGTQDMTQGSDTIADAAIMDLNDIARANMLVLFSVSSTELTRRNGRNVEFGYAVGKGIPVLVVGPKENIFHYLASMNTFWIHHCDTWEEAKRCLTLRKAVERR